MNIDQLKNNWSVVLSVLTGLLILVPSNVLSVLGLVEFVSNTRPILGFIFVLTTILLVIRLTIFLLASNKRVARNSKFKLPDYQDFSSDFTDKLRLQLRSSTLIVKGSQLLVGAILPIMESYLVNLATGTEGNPQPYINTIVLLGSIHFVLLVIVLVVETPLPQFLVQFDSLANEVQQSRSDSENYELYAATLYDALSATQFSLLLIEDMKDEQKTDLSEIFNIILSYWIDERTPLFWFRDGDAYYNFAVYIFNQASGLLELTYRNCDDRIRRTDRAWRPGDGHVGTCYIRQKTLFWSIPEDEEIPENLQTTQPLSSDNQYYRSMIATPIAIEGVVQGVFVVTSSKSEQFERTVHRPIADVVGILLAQSMQYCWRRENESNTIQRWKNRRRPRVR